MIRERLTARERYFVIGGCLHIVPVGKRPEAVGVDPRMAREVETAEPPRFHAWVGPNRGWVQTSKLRALQAAQERREARGRGDWHEEIERRLAALEAMMNGATAGGEG